MEIAGKNTSFDRLQPMHNSNVVRQNVVDIFLAKSSHPFALAVGSFCILLGVLVLIGWEIKSTDLVQLIPGFAPMQPNTAVGFVLTGAGLVATRFQRDTIIYAVAALLTVLAVATAIEIAADTDFGIDLLLVDELFIAEKTANPGRMSPLTAICFLLCAIGLITNRIPGHAVLVSFLSSLLVIAISASTLFVYALNLDRQFLSSGQTEMAVNTGIGFVLAGLSLLLLVVRNLNKDKRTRRPIIVPAAIGAAGLVFAAVAWVAMESQQRQEVRAELHREAQDVATDVRALIEPHVRSLVRKARRWEARGGVPQSEWIADSINYVTHVPGLHMVTRVNTDFTVEWVAPLRGNESVQGLDLAGRSKRLAVMEKARDLRIVRLSTDVDLFRDGQGLVMFVPLFVDGRFDGFVTGAGRLKPMLDYGLRKLVQLGYGIQILEDNEVIYGEPINLPDGYDDLIRESEVQNFNLDWRVRVWPRQELIDRLGSSVPMIVVMISLLMAGLLAIITYQWGALVLHFQELQKTKQDLEVSVLLQGELNASLNQRTAELARSNRELEAFSYSVAHDLRAPLRAMSGFAHALADDYGAKLDAQARDYIDRITSASQRMGQLIDGLLSLAGISKQDIQRQSVDVSSLTEEVAAELNAAYPDRKVDVVVTSGLTVDGDINLIRQLLQNLIGNAFKFTAGKADAKVTVSQTNENDGTPVIVVRDNGVGFDMNYADKLFQTFQRLHSDNEFEGTGVGLATSSRIVERHGGRIWAESTLGDGAVFYFTLQP